ncbi:MAG: ABC transporter ATP-binding protein [Actinomycetota bacterium]|jgi:oligopeptide/dipeptide ABC transporter ATP-binding protein|nr:MAG: ABC transporter ATP-binding protein [Actinomycetota bacterium]
MNLAPNEDRAVLLDVQDLRVVIDGPAGLVSASDGVSFQVRRGEIVGLVGESGCGKTVTALATIGLLPPSGRIAGGRVLLGGLDLTRMREDELREIRGSRVGYVPQDATAALNPVVRVGEQITEVLRAHTSLDRSAARARAIDLLRAVGVPAPARRLDGYPHQLSGGLRQRVAIAIALACDPELVIADEPTTALDVTTQAQVTELLARLAAERSLAVLFISHDLSLVASFTDRVIVMYAGQVVEEGPTPRMTSAPRHPYARALLHATPRLERKLPRLATIEGRPPDLVSPPPGCRFEPRCDRATPRCRTDDPQALRPAVACWHPFDGVSA